MLLHNIINDSVFIKKNLQCHTNFHNESQRKEERAWLPLTLSYTKTLRELFLCRCCSVQDKDSGATTLKRRRGFRSRDGHDAQTIQVTPNCNTGNIPVPDCWLPWVFLSYRCQEQSAVSGPMYIRILVINICSWELAYSQNLSRKDLLCRQYY